MRRNRVLVYLVAAVLVVFMASMVGISAGTTAKTTERPANALAKVNGTYILEEVHARYLAKQLVRLRQAHGVDFAGESQKEQLANLQRQVLEQLVKNELLIQSAYELGVSVTEDEVQAEINRIKATYATEEAFNEVLKQVDYTMAELRADIVLQKTYEKLATALMQNQKVTDEELRQYYQANLSKFSQQEEVRASHILVDTKEKADELLKQIKNGANFEELAKKHSTCPSAPKGGDLGYFGRGRMVPEFENAAFGMKVGEISAAPLKSSFGYHIIKKTDYKEAKVSKFEDVKNTVRDTFVEKKKYDSAMAFMDKKWAEANIEYYVDFTVNGTIRK